MQRIKSTIFSQFPRAENEAPPAPASAALRRRKTPQYGRPYDENGNMLNIQNDKIVGLSLDEIMSVPRRVALAQDKSKSLAIRGALRGHLITELIMSESVAFRVLSESKADVLIEQLKQL